MPIIVNRQLADVTIKRSREYLRKHKESIEKISQFRDYCSKSFLNFLPFWSFTNRETGDILSFEKLWYGQVEFAKLANEEPWIFALKAGKLGFTELECAFDGWRLLFASSNARVHIFSRDILASQDVLRYVKFGLLHLPKPIRPILLEDEAGGDTTQSLRIRMGIDDVRTIISYSAGPKVSIDQSCQHLHMDELAHMPFPEKTWNSAATTVAPGGTCHVVTRGSGDDNFAAVLWRAAEQRSSRLYPFFQPWSSRPDRDRKWFEEQGGQLTMTGLKHFAPETSEDALSGEEQSDYLPLEIWDRCMEQLPPLDPDSKEEIILGVDAAVTNDHFGIVAVTRHPERSKDIAIRAVREWKPINGKAIDFEGPDNFIRLIAQGGCIRGHPKGRENLEECESCRDGNFIPAHNVVQVAYDPYQLESMAQQHRRDGVVWWKPFPQQKDRLIADSLLRDLVFQKRIAHDGNPQLREHIYNAAAKIDEKEDHKIRIIKKSPDRKVDLVVATSMASYRCLYLLIGK